MPNAPTPRLGLVTPSGSDSPPDVAGDYADVFAALDSQVAIDDQGSYSAMPAASSARRGTYYRATDRQIVYRCTGTEWEPFLPQAPIVTSLPTGSSSWADQEVQLRVATNPTILWHLRRVGSWWVPLGDPVALYNDDPADRTSILTSWSDFGGATAGQVTLPAAGIYHARYGVRGWRVGGTEGADTAEIHVGHNGATLVPSYGSPLRRFASSGGESASGEMRSTGVLAAGANLRIIGRLSTSGSLLNVTGRWLAVTPVALVAS